LDNAEHEANISPEAAQNDGDVLPSFIKTTNKDCRSQNDVVGSGEQAPEL
jgi:hypothetical protein